MPTKHDQILRHPGVAPADVDDIVAIASELQDQAREKNAGPTTADLEAVAKELDVDPAYVDEAVREHARRKEAAAQAKVAAEAARAASTRRLAIGGAGLGAMLFASLVGAFGWGFVASSRIEAAQIEADRTEAALVTALDRQQSLAPQLVALAGGTFTPPAAPDATASLDVRLQASDALGRSLAQALTHLPPASDPGTSQQRLNLQYELTGSQNRISVERQRFAQAEAGVAELDRGIGATFAHLFGMVP